MKNSKKRTKNLKNKSKSQEQTAVPFTRAHSDKIRHTAKELRRQAKREAKE